MRVVCCTYQHGDPTEHVERDEALPSRRRRRRRGRGPAAALGVAVVAWRGGAAGLQIHGDGRRRVVAADELVAPHRPRSRPLAAARLRRLPCIGRSSAHEHPAPRGKTKEQAPSRARSAEAERQHSSYNKCVTTRCGTEGARSPDNSRQPLAGLRSSCRLAARRLVPLAAFLVFSVRPSLHRSDPRTPLLST